MKVLTFLSLFSACSAYNILLMFPLSPKSHVNSFVPLFKKLSENGHNITMVAPFKPKIEIPNCTFIIVKDVMGDHLTDKQVQEDVKIFREYRPFSIWPVIWDLHLVTIERLLEGDCLRELLTGNYLFDVMISETLYLLEIFVAFGHIFNVPVISIDAHPLSVWSSYLTGNVHPYSYVPNFRLEITHHMTLLERTYNTLLNIFELVLSYLYYMPRQESYLRKYFNYTKYDFPPLLNMLQNISLTLVDSHFSLGYPRPYHPNTIEVGGLTFYEGGELDEDLQAFLDGSENGFIYLSFGSIINMTTLPAEVLRGLISTISLLKQNVVMKWENDEFPNKPKNLWFMPWLPQKRILAHPNCRLFITHGGIHGMAEAVYHKVPLVVIPFFSDQYYNAALVRHEGLGYVLYNSNVTTENLMYAIHTVLDNPEYKKNLERKSRIMKDRDQDPVDKAVYWVEYVLRHNGAKHLRPASLNLNFFQYFLVDVIIGLSLAFLGCLYLLSWIVYLSKNHSRLRESFKRLLCKNFKLLYENLSLFYKKIKSFFTTRNDTTQREDERRSLGGRRARRRRRRRNGKRKME